MSRADILGRKIGTGIDLLEDGGLRKYSFSNIVSKVQRAPLEARSVYT